MKPALIALLTCLCLGGCGEKSAVEQQAETTPSPTESAPKPKTKEPTEAEKKKFTETKAQALAKEMTAKNPKLLNKK